MRLRQYLPQLPGLESELKFMSPTYQPSTLEHQTIILGKIMIWKEP